MFSASFSPMPAGIEMGPATLVFGHFPFLNFLGCDPSVPYPGLLITHLRLIRYAPHCWTHPCFKGGVLPHFSTSSGPFFLSLFPAAQCPTSKTNLKHIGLRAMPVRLAHWTHPRFLNPNSSQLSRYGATCERSFHPSCRHLG